MDIQLRTLLRRWQEAGEKQSPRGFVKKIDEVAATFVQRCRVIKNLPKALILPSMHDNQSAKKKSNNMNETESRKTRKSKQSSTGNQLTLDKDLCYSNPSMCFQVRKEPPMTKASSKPFFDELCTGVKAIRRSLSMQCASSHREPGTVYSRYTYRTPDSSFCTFFLLLILLVSN